MHLNNSLRGTLILLGADATELMLGADATELNNTNIRSKSYHQIYYFSFF